MTLMQDITTVGWVSEAKPNTNPSYAAKYIGDRG